MTRFLRNRLLLLGILLAGTALRLFRLGADSLWYDETVSTLLAGSSLPELLRHTAGDIHPPLYYILLRAWLIVMGYPTGHADAAGYGLEFAAGFFSLFFGVLLIVLTYALARRVVGSRVATIAAGLVALSPYHVWYSQEVRMYTLGAALGVVAVLSLATGWGLGAGGWRPAAVGRGQQTRRKAWIGWVGYAVAAAAGMYTLYYFAFLLIPLNLGLLACTIRVSRAPSEAPSPSSPAPRAPFDVSRLTFDVSRLTSLLLANLAAVLLYAPWLPIAVRQATDPPVPPWRMAPSFPVALAESWNALVFGQSAPAWAWPLLIVALAVYAAGLVAIGRIGTGTTWRVAGSGPAARLPVHLPRLWTWVLPVATFGPLLVILLVSLVTPLYHVRYLFTYSPAFYVVLAAGLMWLWLWWRPVAVLGAAGWLAVAGITLRSFWFDPEYRPDDHRQAVRALQARWRPGDVLLVNAGYAYPPLLTYWQGPVAGRTRLTAPVPAPRRDDALVIVMTGHVAEALVPGQRLGWDDPQSDFFAMALADADAQTDALFQTFGRVWHYRIYDTVNDPTGMLRARLAERGYLFEDLPFAGEANMRLQGFLPRSGAAWSADLPGGRYPNGMRVQFEALSATVQAGETVYGTLVWRADAPLSAPFGVSLRLMDADGMTWAQPRDERPFGPVFLPPQWPVGLPQRQPIRLPIPLGTPPGAYTAVLLVYDPVTGRPWPPQEASGGAGRVQDGLALGQITVLRRETAALPARARFGPLALIEATSPATVLSPGDAVPVELLWQATAPPGEPLVVVVQLLDDSDRLLANLEEQPLRGRYPTQEWTASEVVRDPHVLQLPSDVPTGTHRLIVGVYRAVDRTRLRTRIGLFGESDHWLIRRLTLR